MATWKRTTSEPITTDRRVRVTDGKREGYVDIFWSHMRPLFRGLVYAETGRVIDDPREEDYAGPREETVVLDRHPSFTS